MKRDHTKKIAAAAVCACLLQPAAALPAEAADSYLIYDGFESGEGGWKGRGGSKVQVSAEQPYQGTGALYVSGRTDSWNGAEKDISAVCKPGETYSFSVCACAVGSQTVDFMLSLTYTGADGKAVYDHIAEVQTTAGFYVQLFNDAYTVPAEAADAVLYVETKSGTASFYVDEVICAAQGTQIAGSKPTAFLLGNADFDGMIGADDLSLARQCVAGNTDKWTVKAADVDRSGQVDAADIAWFQQYLTGQAADYPEPVKPPVEPFDYDPALKYHPFPDNYLDAVEAGKAGQVIKETYNGTTGTNTLYVYLPAGYDESRQYNIFYLLHGGGEDETTLFFHKDTQMQHIFDHMILNGELEPMIIVTPTWNQTGADKFYTEFREKVVPFVEGKYSTYAESTSTEDLQASRYHRAYGGFSMGSISTWGVLMNCLDIVAYYMPLSGDYRVGSLSAYDKAKLIADAIDRSGLEKDEYYIFCATGSEDMAYPNMTPQIEEMRKMPQFVETSDLSQGNFYYLVAQGNVHWWAHVRHYIYDVLPYFFHEHQ